MISVSWKMGKSDGGQGDVMPALRGQQSGTPPSEFDRGSTAKTRKPAQSDRKNQNQKNADQECG
jgi:hypothetical protein